MEISAKLLNTIVAHPCAAPVVTSVCRLVVCFVWQSGAGGAGSTAPPAAASASPSWPSSSDAAYSAGSSFTHTAAISSVGWVALWGGQWSREGGQDQGLGSG